MTTLIGLMLFVVTGDRFLQPPMAAYLGVSAGQAYVQVDSTGAFDKLVMLEIE